MYLRSKIRTWCVLCSFSGLVAAALAQDMPQGVTALTPDKLTYSESPRAPGVLTAPLFGVPSKAEYYAFRAKYPPNTVNAPHHHPGDEELTVISGTLYIGHGAPMDRAKAIAYPPEVTLGSRQAAFISCSQRRKLPKSRCAAQDHDRTFW